MVQRLLAIIRVCGGCLGAGGPADQESQPSAGVAGERVVMPMQSRDHWSRWGLSNDADRFILLGVCGAGDFYDDVKLFFHFLVDLVDRYQFCEDVVICLTHQV
jgi:hypothetical protein